MALKMSKSVLNGDSRPHIILLPEVYTVKSQIKHICLVSKYKSCSSGCPSSFIAEVAVKHYPVCGLWPLKRNLASRCGQHQPGKQINVDRARGAWVHWRQTLPNYEVCTYYGLTNLLFDLLKQTRIYSLTSFEEQ